MDSQANALNAGSFFLRLSPIDSICDYLRFENISILNLKIAIF